MNCISKKSIGHCHLSASSGPLTSLPRDPSQSGPCWLHYKLECSFFFSSKAIIVASSFSFEAELPMVDLDPDTIIELLWRQIDLCKDWQRSTYCCPHTQGIERTTSSFPYSARLFRLPPSSSGFRSNWLHHGYWQCRT